MLFRLKLGVKTKTKGKSSLKIYFRKDLKMCAHITEFKEAGPYKAYTLRTNEKILLQEAIQKSFQTGDFPIKANDGKNNILDVGSGNGINSFFLADLFSRSIIEAIEPSTAQYDEAVADNKRINIKFRNVSVENFERKREYDFILVSHVLQYIYIPVEVFVRKVIDMLKKEGEAWFVQQTDEGISQIIQHQKKFLRNSRFRKWLTFKDYLPLIRKIAGQMDCEVRIDYLDSSITAINFANPTGEDREVLKFILLLDYEKQAKGFKEHLAKLKLGEGGCIKHPNGIAKIRRKE